MSSETKWRSSRRWKKEIPTGPLSLAEYKLFKHKQVRLWKAMGIVTGYALCHALLQELKTHYGLAVSDWVVVLSFFPVVICGMLVMFAFKCPRCGAVPMVKRFSFTTASFEYGSMVALFPKTCGKCGVQFIKPTADGAPSP